MATFTPDPVNDWGDLGGLAAGDTVDGQGQTWTAQLPVAVTGTAGNIITFTNFTIDGTSIPGGSLGHGITVAPASYLTFTDITVHSCTGQCLELVETNPSTFANLRFARLNFTASNGGMRLTFADATDCVVDGVVIEDSIFDDHTFHGVSFYIRSATNTASSLNNIVARRNFARGNGQLGLRFGSDVDATIGHGTSVTCIENVLSGNGFGGLRLSGFDQVNAARNVCNGNLGVIGGIALSRSTSAIIEDNVCSNNVSATIDGNGITLDVENSDVQVLRNELSGNSPDTSATNNGAAIAIYGQNTSIALVGNWGNNNHLAFTGGAAGGQGSVTMRNCTFRNCTEFGVHLSAAFEPDALTLTNNIITGNAADTTTAITSNAITFAESHNTFYDFDANGDLSPGTGTVTTDPEFVSATDPRLDGGSPSISAGTRWWSAQPPIGFDGLRFPLRAGLPDMGAYSVRPGEDGATRTAAAYVPAVLESGVDIPKAKRA